MRSGDLLLRTGDAIGGESGEITVGLGSGEGRGSSVQFRSQRRLY